RRTDGREALLAVVAADPGARHARKRFVYVNVAHGFEIARAHREDARRYVAQGRLLAIGGNDDRLERILLRACRLRGRGACDRKAERVKRSPGVSEHGTYLVDLAN